MPTPELLNDVGSIIASAGLVGTAAYGLVDTGKVFKGGSSRFGFGPIQATVEALLPDAEGAPLFPSDIRATLFANWINGMAKADQKSAAKALIRLCITPKTAPEMARATGLDPTAFTALADAVAKGIDPTQEQLDLLGTYDVIVSAKLDAAYERGDQFYRNANKTLGAILGFGLSLLAAWMTTAAGAPTDWGTAVLVGLLAAPVAPVSKDLSTALTTAVKALQGARR